MIKILNYKMYEKGYYEIKARKKTHHVLRVILTVHSVLFALGWRSQLLSKRRRKKDGKTQRVGTGGGGGDDVVAYLYPFLLLTELPELHFCVPKVGSSPVIFLSHLSSTTYVKES